MKIGGFLTGVLALGALQAATSSAGAAQRAGGLLAFPAKVFTRLADPTVPLIPNYHDSKPAAGQTLIGQ